MKLSILVMITCLLLLQSGHLSIRSTSVLANSTSSKRTQEGFGFSSIQNSSASPEGELPATDRKAIEEEISRLKKLFRYNDTFKSNEIDVEGICNRIEGWGFSKLSGDQRKRIIARGFVSPTLLGNARIVSYQRIKESIVKVQILSWLDITEPLGLKELHWWFRQSEGRWRLVDWKPDGQTQPESFLNALLFANGDSPGVKNYGDWFASYYAHLRSFGGPELSSLRAACSLTKGVHPELQDHVHLMNGIQALELEQLKIARQEFQSVENFSNVREALLGVLKSTILESDWKSALQVVGDYETQFGEDLPMLHLKWLALDGKGDRSGCIQAAMKLLDQCPTLCTSFPVPTYEKTITREIAKRVNENCSELEKAAYFAEFYESKYDYESASEWYLRWAELEEDEDVQAELHQMYLELMLKQGKLAKAIVDSKWKAKVAEYVFDNWLEVEFSGPAAIKELVTVLNRYALELDLADKLKEKELKLLLLAEKYADAQAMLIEELKSGESADVYRVQSLATVFQYQGDNFYGFDGFLKHFGTIPPELFVEAAKNRINQRDLVTIKRLLEPKYVDVVNWDAEPDLKQVVSVLKSILKLYKVDTPAQFRDFVDQFINGSKDLKFRFPELKLQEENVDWRINSISEKAIINYLVARKSRWQNWFFRLSESKATANEKAVFKSISYFLFSELVSEYRADIPAFQEILEYHDSLPVSNAFEPSDRNVMECELLMELGDDEALDKFMTEKTAESESADGIIPAMYREWKSARLRLGKITEAEYLAELADSWSISDRLSAAIASNDLAAIDALTRANADEQDIGREFIFSKHGQAWFSEERFQEFRDLVPVNFYHAHAQGMKILRMTFTEKPNLNQILDAAKKTFQLELRKVDLPDGRTEQMYRARDQGISAMIILRKKTYDLEAGLPVGNYLLSVQWISEHPKKRITPVDVARGFLKLEPGMFQEGDGGPVIGLTGLRSQDLHEDLLSLAQVPGAMSSSLGPKIVPEMKFEDWQLYRQIIEYLETNTPFEVKVCDRLGDFGFDYWLPVDLERTRKQNPPDALLVTQQQDISWLAPELKNIKLRKIWTSNAVYDIRAKK